VFIPLEVQKGPFELLEKESSGALKYEWWAMVDGFVTSCERPD